MLKLISLSIVSSPSGLTTRLTKLLTCTAMFVIIKKFFWLFLGLLFAVTVHGEPKILVLGDSLSAAYGIKQSEGWVALLNTRLQDKGFKYAVVNASISGETSAGALTRLPELLKRHTPAIVIVELGGNDGLQGRSLSHMRANLRRIIELSKESGAQVLLVGMALPPNYGPLFDSAFRQTFRELALQYEIPFVPLLMDGIEANLSAFQADGIHPNAASQSLLLDNVWSVLVKLL